MNRYSQFRSDMTRYLNRVLGGASLDLQFSIELQSDFPQRWVIRFTGPDVPMLTADDGDLLRSLSHLMALSFDFSEAKANLSSIILGGRRMLYFQPLGTA